jgi:hypothetical protein
MICPGEGCSHAGPDDHAEERHWKFLDGLDGRVAQRSGSKVRHLYIKDSMRFLSIPSKLTYGRRRSVDVAGVQPSRHRTNSHCSVIGHICCTGAKRLPRSCNSRASYTTHVLSRLANFPREKVVDGFLALRNQSISALRSWLLLALPSCPFNVMGELELRHGIVWDFPE